MDPFFNLFFSFFVYGRGMTIWRRIFLIWIFLISLAVGVYFICFKNHEVSAIVVIDAGHGGYDTGAINQNHGQEEKMITMEIAYKIGQAIKKLDPTIQVEFTRLDDTVSWPMDELEDLKARIQIANEAQADYFLSIHLNSSTNTDAYGYEGFIKAEDSFSSSVYEKIASSFEDLSYSQDRGLFTQTPLMVVHEQSIPSLLLEVGFISNDVELMKLDNERIQSALAQKIAQAYVEEIHKEKEAS